MKIAIMTQPLGHNYGGIMQAWALQQLLKRMGHEVTTIDRRPEPPSLAYTSARLIYRSCMRLIGKRKAPINIEKYLPIIFQNTKGFIAQHITMSEPLCSTQELRAHFDREDYDAVIVGSDQTWRPRYSPDIYNFYLDFLEDKEILRIAYASSFGVDEWEYTKEETKRCAELAKKFDFISVRESSGIELCRKHLGVDATHVLDPTLLLTQKDYLQLIGPTRVKASPKGVYTYFLDKTTEKLALAEQASRELRQSVYSCQAPHSIETDHNELEKFIMPSPKDWIAGFVNASFVLTDSFHGMVFATINEKNYRVITNNDRGAARFHSISKMLGIENAFPYNITTHTPLTSTEINHKSIAAYISTNRINALSFIKNALSTPAKTHSSPK